MLAVQLFYMNLSGKVKNLDVYKADSTSKPDQKDSQGIDNQADASTLRHNYFICWPFAGSPYKKGKIVDFKPKRHVLRLMYHDFHLLAICWQRPLFWQNPQINA